jgi:hypothetical protein
VTPSSARDGVQDEVHVDVWSDQAPFDGVLERGPGGLPPRVEDPVEELGLESGVGVTPIVEAMASVTRCCLLGQRR